MSSPNTMLACLQDQIDAAVSARVTICLGLAPLGTGSLNGRGGTFTYMADKTINYTPPNDKYNQVEQEATC